MAVDVLDKLIDAVNAKYKSPIIRRGSAAVYVERIPFASPRLNYMTYGGIPIGKATELIGAEGSGKTTTALDICAQAQKKARADFDKVCADIQSQIDALANRTNKDDVKKRVALEVLLKDTETLGPRRVIYVDAENTLDLEWAQKVGVDTDDWILVKPESQTAEQVLQIILEMVETGRVLLLVLDSIPMLVSQKVFEKTLEDKQYAGIADAVSRFSSLVAAPLSKTHTALVLINQVRDNMDNPYDQWNTPGGRALKHLYALRLGFRKGSFIDEDYKEVPQRTEEPAGNLVDVTIVKTKVFKPNRRVGQYTIRYDVSTDVVADTVTMAIKYGLIEVNGSWFTIMEDAEAGTVLMFAGEAMKFQGRGKLIQALREDEYMFEDIYLEVNKRCMEVS